MAKRSRTQGGACNEATANTRAEREGMDAVRNTMPPGFTYAFVRGSRHLLVDVRTPGGHFGRMTIPGTPRIPSLQTRRITNDVRKLVARLTMEEASKRPHQMQVRA